MRLLLPVLLCVLFPLAGFAQAPVTPPPLVPVPSTPEEAPSEDPYGGYDDEEESEPEAPRGEVFRREPESAAAKGRVGRVIAGSLLGLLLEVALGTPGAYLGFVLAISDDSSPAVGIAEVIGLSFLGVTIGSALGVAGGGAMMGGQAEFQVVLGGAALGALLGGLIALPAAFAVEGGWILPVLVSPVVGALIAYEWSHGKELERKAAGASVQVVPMLGVRPSGGFVAGLAGSF